MNITALIEEMAHLAEKIKSGSADLGELEAFVASSKEVYERSIVLRYKAYENKVFGVSQLPKDAISPALAKEEVKTPIQEEKVVLEETLEYATNETSSDESFDLFSFDDVKEEVKTETKVAVKTEETISPVEIEEDEIAVPHISNIIEKIIQEEKKETPIAEPTVEKKPETISPKVAFTGDLHGIYSKVNYSDNSLAARLNNVPIETLQGAFSLSENMQIINELFGGSHDALSDALKILNNLSNREEARGKVSAFANQYSWKTDSEIALAFVQKIDRRYV